MSIPDGYTEAEWNTLSDEERDALTETNEDVGDVNGKAPKEDDGAGAGDGKSTGDDNGNGQDTDKAAAGDDEGTGDGVAGDADKEKPGNDDEDTTGKAGVDEEDDTRPAFVPTYRAEPVENYVEKIAALDQKFEDGDIKLKDYNQERDELVRAQTKAEISAEQNEQVEKQLWQREISDFIDDNQEYKGKMRHAALDIAVKDLAGKPENADKSGRWFLREAHKMVQAELGGAGKPDPKVEDPKPNDKADDKDKGANANKDKPASRKPDLSLVPNTLSNVPAADSSEAAGGEFAYLDKLEGIELERALARLPKEKQDRYLAA